MAQDVPENLPNLTEVSKMLCTLGVGLNDWEHTQTIQAVGMLLENPESLEQISKQQPSDGM